MTAAARKKNIQLKKKNPILTSLRACWQILVLFCWNAKPVVTPGMRQFIGCGGKRAPG